MAEVAKILGVEIGEEFELETPTMAMSYKFAESGLYTKNGYQACGVLNDLITGIHTIKHKPWKPKRGEVYFLADATMESLAKPYTWNDDDDDSIWLERGLVFRTKEEAVEAAEKMLKALEV